MQYPRRWFFLVFFALLGSLPLLAQEIPWEPVSAADTDSKPDPRAMNEGAMILFKRNWIQVRDMRSFYSTRRTEYVRIKIFDDRGKRYADVEITYHKGERFAALEARTITPTGEIIPVSKDQIFDKMVHKVGREIEFRAKTFAFPRAEKGAILEYQFATNEDRFLFLRPHIFDERLFIREAELEFSAAKRLGYTYATQSRGPMEPEIQKGIQETIMHWHLRDLLPLPEEDYQPSPLMLASRVAFVPVFWQYGRLIESWDSVAELYKEAVYDDFTRKSSEMKRLAKEWTAGLGEREAIERLYSGVLERIRPAGTIGIWNTATADELLERGLGDATDRNLMLIAMLRSLKMRAWPVLAATREYSILPEKFPSFSEFDRVICYAETAQGPLFLDAARPGIPPGSLPSESEGIQVVLLEGSKAKILTTPRSTGEAHGIEVQAEIRWEPAAQLKTSSEGNGTLSLLLEPKVKLESRYQGNRAARFRRQLEERGPEKRDEFLREVVLEHISGAEIAAVEVSAPDHWGPVTLTAELRPPAVTQLSNRLLVQPGLWTVERTSPFPSSLRLTPILFLYPYVESETVRVVIPAGYEVEEAPRGQRIETPFAGYELKVTRGPQALEWQRTFSLKQTEFLPTQYPQLRNFHAQVVKWDNTPIVLVRKPSP